MENVNDKEFNLNKNSLLKKIKREEVYSVIKSLADYKYAIDSAESIERPNRTLLLDIYKRIRKDSHLRAVIKHRESSLKGLECTILDKNNKVTDKYDKLFNSKEFKIYLQYVIESIWYGNSLIEVNPNNKGSFDSILIPRENVIPEFKEIKINSYNIQGDFSYDINAYSNVIDVNNNYNKRDLGELQYVAKLLLIKEESLLNWAQFIELFGQPIRIATTDTKDIQELDELFIFLKDLGRSGYMIKNSQTNVELLDLSSKSGADTLFTSLQTHINNEVSKVFLGGTMLTDDGSSRSQSEVHERGALKYTKEDIDFINNNINNDLIPLLIKLGVITEEIHYKLNSPDLITLDEQLKIDQFLIDNFDVEDITYFSNRYNVNLKLKSNESNNKGINKV